MGVSLQPVMGNSHVDGIGGTVKRLVANASLQRINNSQILHLHDMFQYCQSNIPGVEFIYITKDVLVETRKSLEDRFSNAVTIPGTRSFSRIHPTH